VPFTIALGIHDSVANQEAVEAELADLFDREGEPGDGVGRGTIHLAEIRTSIGGVVPTYTLTTPVADVVPAIGQKPVVGAVTFV
jgi:hypothetical protein